jgi:hypothetical protein
MVPETHPIQFPSTPDLSSFLRSAEFNTSVLEKLKTQHEVDITIQEPTRETVDNQEIVIETIVLRFTRNNAGGLNDAIDFLIGALVKHGLDSTTIKGNLPRPKSDSFEDSFPYFSNKILQRAEPPVISTDSPTRATFGSTAEEGVSDQRNFLDKMRKPGSITSLSSLFDRRKNGTQSPGSLFKHASSNASKASLASLESQNSGYRNPWNDSGVNLSDDDHTPWPSSIHQFGTTQTHHSKFPFGAGNGVGTGFSINSSQTSFSNPPSTSASMNAPAPIGSGAGPISNSTNAPGDTTPKLDAMREHSVDRDSGRPSTANSNSSGYPGPIGPPQPTG